LSALGNELRFMMITSEARVHQGTAPPDAVPAPSFEEGGVWIQVLPSANAKCIRCWHHRSDVGVSPDHPAICGRCVGNLSLPGETRRWS
jgi:isoleucyl-tRNA synthetase